MRILLEFGREFVLWDGKRYLMFRLGEADEPLRFGFSAQEYVPDDQGGWTCAFTADSSGGADDLFKTVSAEVMGQGATYTEVNPSFLASMSAQITLGTAQIERITEFTLSAGWQAN